MNSTELSGQSSFVKRYSKTIIFLILLIVILIPLLEIVYFISLKGLYNYYTNLIAKSTGIDLYLVKGIVLLLSLPLLISFRWYFALNPFKWGFSIVIIACYAALFYFGMFYLTHDHYFDYERGDAKRWYYKGADGTIEMFHQPGFHPRYGKKLKEVTPEIVREFEKKSNLVIGSRKQPQQTPPATITIGPHASKRGTNAVLPHNLIASVSSGQGVEDRDGWMNYELEVGQIPTSDLYFVQFVLPPFPHPRELYIIVNGHRSMKEVNPGQNVAQVYSWEMKKPEPNGKIRVSLKGKDWKLPPLEGFVVLCHK